MRLVIMGTGGFAVPSFRAILDSSHEVVALVTRPVRRGRGGRPPVNPMRSAGEDAGIPIHDPNSINDEAAIALVRAWDADLMVVCDYGQILSREALASTRWGGINLHASLLPRYRGAAPINWAIYDGCAETGVSVIHMTARLDAGPVLLQRRTAIQPNETAVELEHRLAEIGAEATMSAIEMLAEGEGSASLGAVQHDQQATKAPRLKKENGRVDWHRSAVQIANQVRAFKPWPGTYTFFSKAGGKSLRLILDEVTPLPSESHGTPGTLMEGPQLLVATGEGCLRLEQVQPEGKKRLPGEEFLRGYRLQVGDQLGN